MATQLEKDKASILAAASYHLGNYYMGSIATADLAHTLGGVFGRVSISDLVQRATPEQIMSALIYCAPDLEFMEENPVKVCECCGSITIGD